MNRAAMNIIGRARRGERIYGEVLGWKYLRTNFIAGFCDNNVLAPFQYSGTTDSDLVEGGLKPIFFQLYRKIRLSLRTTLPFTGNLNSLT